MPKIAVIGGGASGFFAAITAKEASPASEVALFEKTTKLLSKVRISGGGRCNVTHACFDPRQLTGFYPRGGKELLSPFTRFQPKDTIEWFGRFGVKIVAESDGRMFPSGNTSAEIINCFLERTENLSVPVQTQQELSCLTPLDGGKSGWELEFTGGKKFSADRVILSAGSSSGLMVILAEIGYQIEPPVPSLFTFNITAPFLEGLQGISVPDAVVSVEGTRLKQSGPLLITHWGLSGPAVLKLSAWGARILNEINYQFTLSVNWLSGRNQDQVYSELLKLKEDQPVQKLSARSPYGLAIKLWKRFLESAEISESLQLKDISQKKLHVLSGLLCCQKLQANGKSTFKEEFVTCGGVSLKQINFSTMESRLHKNIYFTGELLDIDAVTGGFNFQACWTTGWIAGNAAAGEAPIP
ncbi:MAG: NAD(P)/FAD-dependent oxidoreductase [Ignavibacteriaceae bacterium]|nr:NAD(P)/FAD-dependent oxidoreductase [Ignavibacteriaceae bacterium]